MFALLPLLLADGPRRRRGWRALDGALSAQVHLAHLKPDGSLAGIPDNAHIVIEIGANTRNTLDRELLPQRPDTFLLTFEPLLDKYATLLARNSRPDMRGTLGAHHQRGLVLPFAVSSEPNGVATFKISGRTDGCASLLDAVSSYYSQDCTNVSGVLERRHVPSVSLEVVLRDWLAGRPVALTKVDAQGLDVGVVRSAGPLVANLQAVQLEVVRDRPRGDGGRCDAQYAAEAGRPSEVKCGAVVQAMRALGFEPYATSCAVHKFKEAGGCEAEMMFVRPGRFDEPLVRSFCMAGRPHSCGPGAWSLKQDRRGWDAATRAWAEEAAKGWPAELPPRASRGGGWSKARGRRGAKF